VVYDRDGPSHVVAAVLDDDGQRGWATSHDDQLMGDAMSSGIAGRAVERSAQGELR
jgi:hypothetical protein